MKKKAKSKKKLTKEQIQTAVTKIYPEADFPPDPVGMSIKLYEQESLADIWPEEEAKERITGCGGKGYFTP